MKKGFRSIEEFDQLLLPALFTTAQLDAPSLKLQLKPATIKEFAISTFIGYFQRGYFTIMAHEEEFNRFLSKL